MTDCYVNKRIISNYSYPVSCPVSYPSPTYTIPNLTFNLFYLNQWPHITQFTSWEHLFGLLTDTNIHTTHNTSPILTYHLTYHLTYLTSGRISLSSHPGNTCSASSPTPTYMPLSLRYVVDYRFIDASVDKYIRSHPNHQHPPPPSNGMNPLLTNTSIYHILYLYY